MVSYHYLNRLFIDRIKTTRSGSIEITRSKQSNVHEAITHKENERQISEQNKSKLINRMTLRCRRRQRQLGGDNQKQPLVRSNSARRRNTFAMLDINLSSPSLLYITSASITIIILMIGHSIALVSANNSTQASNNDASYLNQATSRWNSRSPSLPPFRPSFSSVDLHRIGSNFMRRFQRFPYRGGGGPGPQNSDTRFPDQQVNPMTRLMNRLRQQMGARNSIRVHNAFRDFAWRILGSLSMPTPVIYELRRQNFYSPNEDMVNDKFYNRNTTKTIRSKRSLIEPMNLGMERASKSDEDDEPETFRDRLRMRFDDLLSLSRRSLFGRVVRLPSLFPFKRQEDEEETDSDDRNDDGAAGKGRSTSTTTSTTTTSSRRPRLLALASRRKKRRELDRQMISINGKQYYVDDDGELREWKEDQ